MLWPLADKPRLAPGVPGGTTPVRLMDDELATSLAPGGRLDTLLGAAEFATSPAVDPDGAGHAGAVSGRRPGPAGDGQRDDRRLHRSDSHDGLGTASHPGTGQAAASAWLARLRALAGRMCVAAAPYAQADLDALQRVGDAGLSSFTVNGAADLVEQILGVPSTRGATLVGDGPLDARVVDLLNAQGNTVAIAAADCAAADSDSGAATTADSRRAGCHHRSSPPRSTRASAPPWPPPAPTRWRRRIWTTRWRCRCTTIHRSHAARTRWPRCCGEGWTPRSNPAARS